MNAYASASGGVIFIPEKIERKTNSVSYTDFIKEQPQETHPTSFGKRGTEEKKDFSEAA